MGFFSSLFKAKNQEESKANFSILHSDMHSHLIPGIDDGSKSVAQSVQLVRGLADLGFRKLITTPHVMSEGYRNTPEIIRGGLNLVNEELRKQGIQTTLEAAAEYYCDEMFEQRFSSGEMLSFGDRFLLYEISLAFRPGHLRQAIFTINSNGYKPVLAHVERYPYLHSRDLRLIREVKDMGTFLQLNITSLTGIYGRATQAVARQLVECDLVEFIGTDLHNEMHLDHLSTALNDPWVQRALRSERLMNSTL